MTRLAPRALTAMAVANAKPGPARREIADGTTPGLRLVIQPTGVKSWAFRYEADGGKQVKMTLGAAAGSGALSLAEAREKAGEARKLRSQGVDPNEARKSERAAAANRVAAEKSAADAAARRDEERVAATLDRYYAAKARDGLKSLHEVRRLLDKEMRAPWASRHVGEIARKDVIRLVDQIAERGAGTTANRTLANVRAFFSWCEDKGLIEANPCKGVKPPKKEVQRDRALTDDELRLLSLALNGLDWPWGQFFRLALLTGQRREEIAEMRLSELKLDGPSPTWTLPPARTKNGKEHAVPLAPAALVAIREALAAPRRPGDSDLVLTTTGETGVSGFSRAKAALDDAMLAVAMKEATEKGEDPSRVSLAPWRLHDLRRTAASGMAARGVSIAVVEKVLNHVSGTFAGIVSVYQVHHFADEKRHALNLWAEHVTGLIREASGSVVSLRA